MLSLILTLLAANPVEAKLPKLGFAAKDIHCSIQWASPTSYQPEGIKATFGLVRHEYSRSNSFTYEVKQLKAFAW